MIAVRVCALAQFLAADITLVILVLVQALAQCLAADIALVILVLVQALAQCLAADIALVILVRVIMSAFRFIPADRASMLAIAPFAKGVGSFFHLHRATTTISLLVCVFGFDPVSFRSCMAVRIQFAIFLAAGLALCLFLASGPAASVPAGRDILRLGLFTDAAGEGLHAGGGTGCSGGDSAVVPGVIAILPAGLEDQVGKGEKAFFIPRFIGKLVLFKLIIPHRSGDQPAIEKLSFRSSKAAFRQRVVCAGASV